MGTRSHGLFEQTRPQLQHAKQADYIYELDEPGISTGVIIEGEGVLFIGKRALREMGEVMGWTFIEEGQSLEEDLAYALHELELVKADRDELRAELDVIGRAVARGIEAAK